MTDQIYKLTSVRLNDESIELEFTDGLRGELSFNELDLPSPIQDIDEEHLNSTDGLEVKLVYENNDQEVFPWDYFRAQLDEEYGNQQKETKNEELKIVGRRVKQFRNARGLTQEDLARRAGIGRTTLSRLENGKQFPRFQTLMSIASALDISFQKLMLDENTSSNEPALA